MTTAEHAEKFANKLMGRFKDRETVSVSVVTQLVETGFIGGCNHELRKSIASLTKKLSDENQKMTLDNQSRN